MGSWDEKNGENFPALTGRQIPDPETNRPGGFFVPEAAKKVAEHLLSLFGKRVAGIYLYGSAVSGGLKPQSDVDILFVVHDTIRSNEKNALTSFLLEFSGKNQEAGRPLEVTGISLTDVRPWKFPPKCLFQYGEWLRNELESGKIPEPFSSPDLAILLRQIRGASLPLYGPAAQILLEPVPYEDLYTAILQSIPELRANLSWDRRNVLLTFARMWYTAATGEITSKDAAAQWVLIRMREDQNILPYACYLENACRAYRGEEPDLWPDAASEIDKLAAYMQNAVVNRIREKTKNS